VASAIAALRLLPWRAAVLYGVSTAAACGAAAVSAFSHSIIAEGQVTAMVVPVAFVCAAVGAGIVSAIWYRDVVSRLIALGMSFAILAFAGAWKLPVVQFRDGGASTDIYPVTGSALALFAGVIAGLAPRIGPTWWIIPGLALAGAAGYVVQMWFGMAIAAVGVGLALGVDE